MNSPVATLDTHPVGAVTKYSVPPVQFKQRIAYISPNTRTDKILFTCNFFPCLDTSLCESADNPPTLPTLRHFPVNGRFIDIAEEIGPNFEKFGTLLLEDKNGNKVTMVTMSEHDDPLPITVKILQQWLHGKGRLPVTWQTLVKCLRDIHLNVLADKMDHSLSEHNSDHPYPQELQ